MKFRLTHIFVAFTAIAVALAAILNWRATYRSFNGFDLTHRKEQVRISWSTGSGFNISPTSTMKFNVGVELAAAPETFPLPELSHLDDVWMWDIELGRMGAAMPAHFVNPRNRNPLDDMVEMLSLWLNGQASADQMTRIAAKHYIYLGFAVRSQADVDAVLSHLSNRTPETLNSNFESRGRRIYALRHGVEKLLAVIPDDTNEVQEILRTTPVLFERIDRSNGHPGDTMHVLYLDGHVEELKIGTTFPATQEFVDSFTDR